MDNITHSFTGAAMSKYLTARQPDEAEAKRARRVFFWLMVGSANFPDLDVLLNLVMDPLQATAQHRGLSHSVLFAPILALAPAGIFYVFSKVKDFKALWTVAVIGTYLHILFDLITSYGTQIFQPFSNERYSLDLMFIIDPFFTIPLGLLLLWAKLGKTPLTKRLATAFMAAYLVFLAVNQVIAYNRVQNFRKEMEFERAALPQPLSPFKWMGLTRTDKGVERYFISNLNDEVRTTEYIDSTDRFAALARATEEGKWCWEFSRFPHIVSERNADSVRVRIYDMQFAFDEQLARDLGFDGRQVPFAMEFNYAPDETLRYIRFNGKMIRSGYVAPVATQSATE
jgi:inner membrane protein